MTRLIFLAYVDPGTGSAAIQVVIASIAAASYFIKVFWKQIVAASAKILGRKQPSEQD